MQTIPQWPTSIPRNFLPVAKINHDLRGYNMADLKALEASAKQLKRQETLKCSQSYRQMLYARSSDFATLASFTSEASLLSGNSQPVLWHPFFDFTQGLRTVSFYGDGVLGCTGTPTYTFQARLGSAAASLAGASIGVSAAITTASGITNQAFSFRIDLVLTTTIGIGSGNTTVSAAGFIKSPGGFAAPYEYSLIPNQAALATWTAVCDAAIDNYFNFSVTCSASSASNVVTLKRLFVEALN